MRLSLIVFDLGILNAMIVIYFVKIELGMS